MFSISVGGDHRLQVWLGWGKADFPALANTAEQPQRERLTVNAMKHANAGKVKMERPGKSTGFEAQWGDCGGCHPGRAQILSLVYSPAVELHRSCVLANTGGHAVISTYTVLVPCLNFNVLTSLKCYSVASQKFLCASAVVGEWLATCNGTHLSLRTARHTIIRIFKPILNVANSLASCRSQWKTHMGLHLILVYVA